MLHHRGHSTLLIITATALIIIIVITVSGAVNTSVVDAIHHRHPMIAFSTATSSSVAAGGGLRQLLDSTIIRRRKRLPMMNNKLKMMSSSSQQQQQHDDDGDEANNSLSQQLAARLIHGKSNNSRSMKACIAIAGGGSSAISSIASTSGASSLLLEGIVTYDRLSFAKFVSANLNADVDNTDGVFDYNIGDSDKNNKISSGGSGSSSSNDHDNNKSSSFSFCSAQAAILLSQSALSRGVQLSPNFHDRSLYCVGVGCASVLYGGSSHRLDEGTDDGGGGDRIRTSKAYIAISSLREGTIVTEVKLEDDSNNNNNKANFNNDDDGAKKKNKRSRAEEETVLSNLILSSMIKYKEQLKEDDGDYPSIIQQILDREGDEITTLSSSKLCNNDAMMSSSCLPAEGARQIIEGNANIVSILPVTDTADKKDSSTSSSFHMETTLYDKQIPFPNDILIVPGSYNPPHHGHIGLANAAVLALRRFRQIEEKDNSRYSSLESFASNTSSSSSSSSLAILKNVWDTVDQHTDNTYDPTVLFEMSVTNADKPPLDPSEVERRINFFSLLPVDSMPNDWGVILTNAPLFSQKTSLLEQVMNNNNNNNASSSSSSSGGRRMTFVLGTDTFVRIINPKSTITVLSI